MAIVGQPGAFQGLDRLVEVVDDARLRVAGLESGSVDKGFEGGPGLAVRLHRAIERADGEVPSPDERADVPGARIDRDESGL